MRTSDAEQEMLREFAAFVDTDPGETTQELDRAVQRMVAKDLRPAPRRVFAKLTLIGAATGMATLTVCPQFGMGFGQHHVLLHRLHAAASPAVFYFICGMLFVTFGAVLGGFVLTRHEIRAVSTTKNRYFAVYSVLAYMALVILGPEAFAAASLAWVAGALLGNILGYGAVVRIAQAGVWR